MAGSTTSDDIEDEKDGICEVDMLQDHGINAADIKKLKDNHYHTIASVHAAMRKTLLNIRGFSDIKVEKVKEAVKKCLPDGGGFITGSELGHRRKKLFSITTGSKQLDAVLAGGFQTMSICEVFGEYRCGKTQLCHTMAVTAQLPKDMGGAAGKVAIIDTEGTFRPERINQIAIRFGLDPEATNDNILWGRALNSEHQMDLLCALAVNFKGGDFHLLIIDSIINAYRADYVGRGELADRQQHLNQFLHKCAEYAEEFNLCVLMTNQVQSDPGASSLFAGADGRKACGGHIMAHAATTRLLLRKGRGEERVAKVVDSPEVSEREAIYVITAGGIDDPAKV